MTPKPKLVSAVIPGRYLGRIDYRPATDKSGPVWIVRARADVLLIVHRLFPKAARMEKGTVRVSATIDRTADLAWVCQRYPMEIGAPTIWADYLARHKERTDAVALLEDPTYVPRTFPLALEPRMYQRTAADLWLKTKNLLLADDVGLGKTVTALAALTDKQTRPALVVAMAHLTTQWARESRRFIPGARVHVLKKSKPYDLRDLYGLPDIIITTYHKLDGWQGYLAGKVKSIVFDECQELRRTGSGRDRSKKYDAASAIADTAPMVMGMSATPVYNHGSEIFNVLDVIAPGRLGTREEFYEEWCEVDYSSGKESRPVKHPKALGEYLRATGIMLLRRRADVGRELPEVTKVVQATDADLAALATVDDRVAELARLVLEGIDHKERFKAAGELDWKMRQATGLAKAPFVAEFVRMLVDNGEKVVLYGWHHAVYDVWMDKLKDLKPVKFTGEEALNQKDEARTAFIKGEAKVLIMSLRSGAGLDGLQHVSQTVVFGELDWSPAVHEQAIGRVHRDGQARPCVAYYCLADDGADPVMADSLGLKEAQSQGLRGGTDAQVFGAPDKSTDAIRKLAQSVLARKSGGTAKSA